MNTTKQIKITRSVLPKECVAQVTWFGPDHPRISHLTEVTISCDLDPNDGLEEGKAKIEEKIQEALDVLYLKLKSDLVEAIILYREVPYIIATENAKKVISIVSMMLGPEGKLLAYPGDPNFSEKDFLPECLCKSANLSPFLNLIQMPIPGNL